MAAADGPGGGEGCQIDWIPRRIRRTAAVPPTASRVPSRPGALLSGTAGLFNPGGDGVQDAPAALRCRAPPGAWMGWQGVGGGGNRRVSPKTAGPAAPPPSPTERTGVGAGSAVSPAPT